MLGRACGDYLSKYVRGLHSHAEICDDGAKTGDVLDLIVDAVYGNSREANILLEGSLELFDLRLSIMREKDTVELEQKEERKESRTQVAGATMHVPNTVR